MTALAHRADSALVTSTADAENNRGAAIRRRVDRLGIGDREWHALTGIDRKTLHRAMNNVSTTRPGTYAAIEAELDRLEAKMAGQPVAERRTPEADDPSLVRIEVPNVYGTKALIFTSAPENLPAVEAMIDRIMRRRAAQLGDEGALEGAGWEDSPAEDADTDDTQNG